MAQHEDKTLSFLTHLDELRARLIRAFLAVVACSVIFYFYVDNFLGLLIKPVGRLIYTSPADAFVARLILTLLGGFILALPFVFYETWKFVKIGLTPQENRHVRVFGPLSFGCFILGAVFAYFIMIPISLQFLLSFSSPAIIPMIMIDKYIAFVGTLILACGVIFEVPLVLMFLTKIGIATPAFLIQKRKYAIVIILVMSALLTPPDVATQLLLAAPLLLLYEVGVVLSKWVYRGPDL